ncbi:uncharacterized protein LOC107633651 [Arachis ipaensis]|uniref:uncharacterized protein LOC107633651 n=1 Tax=Arachis ipaensis TaxID=130454 RepID=UPI0007AF0E09|nr:uncharacterized protein LOC107633651 [Arachis ipaensis]
MQLKQGSLSMVDYTSRFEELCRFSRACQGALETYESWKCIKYQRGLKDDIMTAVAPIEIRIFSDLVNKARVIEEYAKTVASSRDTHGGNTSRERDDYLGQRGQNFKRDVHTPQHLLGQGNFRRDNNSQFHHMRGRRLCYACGLPGHLAKNCRCKRSQIMGQNQQSGRALTLDTRDATGLDPLTRGLSESENAFFAKKNREKPRTGS